MKIETYVIKHWDELPKSTFDGKEVIIISCTHDSNEGWGHHSYGGWGIDKDGGLFYCTSGGCSCYSSCDCERRDVHADEQDFDLSTINWKDIDFNSLEVNFSSYD